MREVLFEGESYKPSKVVCVGRNYVEHMIYKIDTILSEIKSFMSLEDGDIIMSGTPKGVGSYTVGQKFKLVLKDGGKIVLEKEFIVEKK